MNDRHPLAHLPFSYQEIKDGRVQIFHQQRLAMTLKGKPAEKFLLAIEDREAIDQQLQMARVTGQFKFGNERSKS